MGTDVDDPNVLDTSVNEGEREGGLELCASMALEDAGGKSTRAERARAMPAQSCEASETPLVSVVGRSCDELTGESNLASCAIS